MVGEYGLEAKPKKLNVIEDMKSLTCHMEVQYLNS